jgi:hypothetical protein
MNKKILALLIGLVSYDAAQAQSCGPLSLYSTDAYAFFGTLGNASTTISSNYRTMKLTNKGKVELSGDMSSLPTADISNTSDSSRMKIGGGADTNTEHGARVILSGKNYVDSPGSLILQAGIKTGVGNDGKGAFAAIYTSSYYPVIVGVNDGEFVRFEPDRKVNFLQPIVTEGAQTGIEVKVNGELYFLPLIKR